MHTKRMAGVGLVLTAAAVLAAGPAYATGRPAAAPAPDDHGQNSHALDAHLQNAARKAAKAAGAVLDTGTPGSGGLLGAPEGSYTLTSATYSMGRFGDSPQVLAACGSGYYVDFAAGNTSSTGPYYEFNVTVNSSSSYVGHAFGYPGDGWQQVGTDSSGNPLYQGFYEKLSNDNPFKSESGSFTWTCAPLG